MQINLPEVEALTAEVRALSLEIKALKEKLLPQKLWYSRAELAALKGVPVSALYNKPWLLPGAPAKQAGSDRWSFQQVWDSGWIWKSDRDLIVEKSAGRAKK